VEIQVSYCFKESSRQTLTNQIVINRHQEVVLEKDVADNGEHVDENQGQYGS